MPSATVIRRIVASSRARRPAVALELGSDPRPGANRWCPRCGYMSVVKLRYAELTPMSLRSDHVDPPNPKSAGETKRKCQALPAWPCSGPLRISSGLDAAMRIRF